MKLNRSILFVLFIGVLSAIALIYFYIIQRDFTKNHREFLISLNSLENSHSDLNYLILQNSVYIYQNQDKIDAKIKELEFEYETLKKSNILEDITYQEINKSIKILKIKIYSYLNNIDDYVMFNARIKNSLLFLDRHIENKILLEAEEKLLFIEANRILKNLYNTKMMVDFDYLKGIDYLLSSDSQDTNIQNYIEKFNLHSLFIVKNYKEYIFLINSVLNDDIDSLLTQTLNEFNNLALKDFNALDIFALIVFTLFLLALSLIIYLLYSYIQKNHILYTTSESLKHSITYDMLTNLYNRKMLETKLPLISKPSVILIDIDSFKNINDIYGNEIGNLLLIELAKFIKNELFDTEELGVFRLGSDEFCVLFDNIDLHEVENIANMLEKKIAQHIFVFDNLKLNIYVNIVINDIFPILENADLALKVLKNIPTKRVEKYTNSLNLKENVQENMRIVEIIKNAILEDRVIPYFQAIVNLQTLRIEKYEALVRIKLEDGTILSPCVFLEVSKKSSQYYEITEIMIRKTIEKARKYPQYRFSLNLSMLDIVNTKITDILFDCYDRNLTIVTRIDIELLESEFLEDTAIVQEFIEKIHSYGSNVLIDDFGSGYSNFSYFSDLNIDTVKIDGSIVKEIAVNDKKLLILKTIHQFTKGMNMVNIAEYVENREIAVMLKEIGVEYAQGYYFSQPLPQPLDSDEVIL